MSLYGYLTNEELVRAVDNLPNATDMEKLLAARLAEALEQLPSLRDAR